MQAIPYLTLVYSLIVILSGIMDYQHTDRYLALFLEALLGAVIFVCSLFMIKNKIIAHYISAACSFFLIIYYGYFFASTIHFFPGVLTALSAYIFVMQFIKIFRKIGLE